MPSQRVGSMHGGDPCGVPARASVRSCRLKPVRETSPAPQRTPPRLSPPLPAPVHAPNNLTHRCADGLRLPRSCRTCERNAKNIPGRESRCPLTAHALGCLWGARGWHASAGRALQTDTEHNTKRWRNPSRKHSSLRGRCVRVETCRRPWFTASVDEAVLRPNALTLELMKSLVVHARRPSVCA